MNIKKLLCWMAIAVALPQVAINGYRYAIWKIKLSRIADRVKMCSDYDGVTNVLRNVDFQNVSFSEGYMSGGSRPCEKRDCRERIFICTYQWLMSGLPLCPPSCERWEVKKLDDTRHNNRCQVEVTVQRFFVPFVPNESMYIGNEALRRLQTLPQSSTDGGRMGACE